MTYCNKQIKAEIYTYKMIIDLTDYISNLDDNFDDTNIIDTFCSIVSYPPQSFDSISFNKNDNRLMIDIYYEHQVKSIFKELEKLDFELFKHELKHIKGD